MVIPVLPKIKDVTYTAWHPITLEGGGLIHIALLQANAGAVLEVNSGDEQHGAVAVGKKN